MPIIPANWEAEAGESCSKADLGKISKRPYLKNRLKPKMAGGVAQVAE
jgi:hypothetical protein